MKNILNALIFLVIIMAYDSCKYDRKVEINNTTLSSKDREDIKVLRFPEKGEDTLKTSYFADTVLYIPLETIPESFIRVMKQVYIDDSIILINNHQNLLKFSINGTFNYQIGKQGKGPGEYIKILNFEVIGDTIYLSSTGKSSLINYSLNGTFYNEISMRHQTVYFRSTNDGIFTYYHYPTGRIYSCNLNFNCNNTIVVEHNVTEGRYRYVFKDIFFQTYFQKTTEGLFFNNYVHDTIWEIKRGTKQAAYVLDMKNKLLPEDKQIEFSGGNFEKWERMASAYKMINVIPFASYILIFEKHWLGGSYSSIYMQIRNAKEIKKYSGAFIFDDLVGQQKISNLIFTSSDNFLIGSVSSLKLNHELKTNKDKIKKKASPFWLDQMQKIDENDNDILVLIKVKKELK